MQHWRKKVEKNNNKIIESYLHKLQKLEKRINEGDDDGTILSEVNTIIDGLTRESQKGIVKTSIGAKLKVVNESDNPDPSFEKEGDSGFDIRAFVPFEVKLPPGKIKMIPTGLYFEIDKGLEVQVRPRSGLAVNKGITVLNAPGTVDSGYRGEIKIILANLGEFPLTVQNGDRIAQGVVCPVYGEGNLEILKVEELSNSERSDGGFGHTGVK